MSVTLWAQPSDPQSEKVKGRQKELDSVQDWAERRESYSAQRCASEEQMVDWKELVKVLRKELCLVRWKGIHLA